MIHLDHESIGGLRFGHEARSPLRFRQHQQDSPQRGCPAPFLAQIEVHVLALAGVQFDAQVEPPRTLQSITLRDTIYHDQVL